MPTSNDSATSRSLSSRLLREPLLHFTLIGALLFAFSRWGDRGTDAVPDKRIALTQDDLNQLVIVWRAQGFAEPTSEQFQQLLEAKIREEVLFREAVAMGLDRDDTIVKRRMAQKMDFLAEDLSTLREPTEPELEAWLASHPQDFAFPPRIDFRHLYFSFDRHRDQTREAAADALEKTNGLSANAPEVLALGDPFMFKDVYTGRTPDHLAKEFGGVFAKAIFQQNPGAWSGPIESGYGWHLVFIDSISPSRVPDYDEVKEQVRAQWETHQRAEFKKEAYRVMREKYQVTLPEMPPVATANDER